LPLVLVFDLVNLLIKHFFGDFGGFLLFKSADSQGDRVSVFFGQVSIYHLELFLMAIPDLVQYLVKLGYTLSRQFCEGLRHIAGHAAILRISFVQLSCRGRAHIIFDFLVCILARHSSCYKAETTFISAQVALLFLLLDTEDGNIRH